MGLCLTRYMSPQPRFLKQSFGLQALEGKPDCAFGSILNVGPIARTVLDEREATIMMLLPMSCLPKTCSTCCSILGSNDMMCSMPHLMQLRLKGFKARLKGIAHSRHIKDLINVVVIG